MLALQLMRLMKDVCDSLELNVTFFPYNVIATDPGCGVIECVPNSRSRDQIGRQTDSGRFFLEYLLLLKYRKNVYLVFWNIYCKNQRKPRKMFVSFRFVRVLPLQIR